MTPQSPKTPLEAFEAAADRSLLKLAVQCSPQIYRNNSDVEREQTWKEELDRIRQAAIAYKDAEVRATLERLKEPSSAAIG